MNIDYILKQIVSQDIFYLNTLLLTGYLIHLLKIKNLSLMTLQRLLYILIKVNCFQSLQNIFISHSLLLSACIKSFSNSCLYLILRYDLLNKASAINLPSNYNNINKEDLETDFEWRTTHFSN